MVPMLTSDGREVGCSAAPQSVATTDCGGALVNEPGIRWPRRVYGSGDEPDPRFSLANERTFLAWIRTTLALLAGAAAVHALDLSVSQIVQRISSAILATAGLLAAIHAWLGWAKTESALRNGRPLPSNAAGILLVIVVAAVSIVLIIIGARG